MTIKSKLVHKAFTLVEMLIVIVIIGILAAALIPRLQGMQGRARDTARKADLNQLGTAFTVYFADNGSFPVVPGATPVGGNTDNLTGVLVPAYMSSIPQDPDKTRLFVGIGSTPALSLSGSYKFMPITRNGFVGSAVIIMAATEEAGSSSNFIATGDNITTATIFDSIKDSICKNITRVSTVNAQTNCNVDEKKDRLRYIYVN